MEIRFLYTRLRHYKKAVTKTGCPKAGVTHFIITEGKSYSECLNKAKNEARFNENQLLGSRWL